MRNRFLLLILFIFFGSVSAAQAEAQTVYVLAAPYREVTDSIHSKTLQNFWKGMHISAFDTLSMDTETLAVFRAKWGDPAQKTSIQTLADDQLLSDCWSYQRTWALIPFEQLDPRWKVITVDGSSPFDFNFDPEYYALSVPVGANGVSNFDPDKLTSLTLTGTTAMSRKLAYHMEEDGLYYPVEHIGETLAASDITHISNEASFSPDCPPGSPLREEARFCSAPSYFAVLDAVGADVIELTGNHNLDWGYEPFTYSLDLYQKAGMKTYGGGLTLQDAQKPLLIEHHGNKIALLGCNAIGPESVFATDTTPGAARCDLQKMKQQILDLKADGWLPVVTFQHLEYTWYDVPALQSHDFFELANDAAPVIISGSQAHIPQGMTFVGSTFIHFGLGNLFFDQMSDVERTSFFDRHYFYNGRYIGNRLETIILENASQPRFLKPAERNTFLSMIFDTCSWDGVFKTDE